jgi:hypothetical protein
MTVWSELISFSNVLFQNLHVLPFDGNTMLFITDLIGGIVKGS